MNVVGKGIDRSLVSGKVNCMRLLLIALLPALLISGCSKYPIKKDNVLSAPIHIEMPTSDGTIVKSPEEFTADVLTGLDSFTVDDLGRSKAAEFITAQYASEFVDKKVDSNRRIEDALRKSISETGEYMKLSVDHRRPAHSNLDQFSIRWTGNDGLATFKVKSSAFSAGYVKSGTTVVSMNLTQQTDSKKISADISSISYVINCVYAHNTTCIFEDVKVDENNLVYLLSNSSSSPAKTPTVADFQGRVKSYLRNRFVKQRNTADKIERTYHLDFATAKSRLQRAMGAFKYDDGKSTFRLEESYHNPVANNNSKAEHSFVISLYPDRNDTVILFSGSYDYFEDTFGGADRSGGESFGREIDGYIASVDKLLKK